MERYCALMPHTCHIIFLCFSPDISSMDDSAGLPLAGGHGSHPAQIAEGQRSHTSQHPIPGRFGSEGSYVNVSTLPPVSGVGVVSDAHNVDEGAIANAFQHHHAPDMGNAPYPHGHHHTSAGHPFQHSTSSSSSGALHHPQLHSGGGNGRASGHASLPDARFTSLPLPGSSQFPPLTLMPINCQSQDGGSGGILVCQKHSPPLSMTGAQDQDGGSGGILVGQKHSSPSSMTGTQGRSSHGQPSLFHSAQDVFSHDGRHAQHLSESYRLGVGMARNRRGLEKGQPDVNGRSLSQHLHLPPSVIHAAQPSTGQRLPSTAKGHTEGIVLL